MNFTTEASENTGKENETADKRGRAPMGKSFILNVLFEFSRVFSPVSVGKSF